MTRDWKLACTLSGSGNGKVDWEQTPAESNKICRIINFSKVFFLKKLYCLFTLCLTLFLHCSFAWDLPREGPSLWSGESAEIHVRGTFKSPSERHGLLLVTWVSRWDLSQGLDHKGSGRYCCSPEAVLLQTAASYFSTSCLPIPLVLFSFLN